MRDDDVGPAQVLSLAQGETSQVGEVKDQQHKSKEILILHFEDKS